AERDHARLLPVATQGVAETHLAAREPHRSTRHRSFAEIEGRAVAANPPAQHDKTILALAQALIGRQFKVLEMPRDLLSAGMGKHGHCRLAPRFHAVFVLFEPATRGHAFPFSLA